MNRMIVVSACAAVALAGCRYSKSSAGADGASAGADKATLLAASGEETDAIGGVDVNADETALEDALSANRPFSEYLSPVEGAAFEPVYFGFDASSFAPSEAAKIEAVARDLSENPSHVVVVEGNCDERGSNEYNLVLGENRAIAVRDYMVRLGVAADRVQTTSFGEEKPADPGHSEAAWQKNRRGEFSLYQR